MVDPEALASSVVYSTQATHLRWTMVDGRILYQNGKVHFTSPEQLVGLVRRAHAEIQKRMGKQRLS